MKKNLKLTNEELMQRVQKGDLAAFEALYERFYKQLFHFIVRFVKEQSLAEDILQETFLRIFKERKRYRKTARFSTYLFTIARNLCLDALKTWERKHVLSTQEDFIERAMDLSKGPSKIVENDELSQILQRAIDALPRDQREVLLLNKYSGLSYEEIAQIVESTPTAVKQKAYRAMLSLRQKLKKMDD
ncbi:MAG: RNA polymerase sigma-70 factor [Syntrophobacteria bacterium]